MPLSGVCLNQEGSFAPRDCAILSRDIGCSSAVARSGEGCGERAALFSAAIIDNGFLTLPDCGLRCQESVPDLDNAFGFGEGFEGSGSSSVLMSAGFRKTGGAVRVSRSEGVEEPVSRSRASSRGVEGSDGGSMVGEGEAASFSCGLLGVFTEERSDWGVVDFSGEIERARSVEKNRFCNQQSADSFKGMDRAELTGSLPCSLSTTLQDVVLKLARSLGVLLVSLLAQESDLLNELGGVYVGCVSRRHRGCSGLCPVLAAGIGRTWQGTEISLPSGIASNFKKRLEAY